MCRNYAPLLRLLPRLRAATCECHLCWKPPTAFLSASVGVSLPGVLDGHWSMSWAFGLSNPPLLHRPFPCCPPHFQLCDLRAAKVRGLTCMRERAQYLRNISPNVNGKGQRGENSLGVRSGACVSRFCFCCATAFFLRANLWNLVLKCRGVLWGLPKTFMHLLAVAS